MAPSSDDSEDEDFVTLGTPLPDLDENEPLKKPTTAQDLTAKDKEGRRRFHGAFTGGFSAGYFNTVGSKEGFTPSTFVSSRSQKHDDSQTYRPEDFMDDEDLEEHGIAPRKFATAKNYTSEERKRKQDDLAKGITATSTLDIGTALTDLIVPEYLPVGIKLLRKMGWREGQGLGPRVRRKKMKAKEKRKPVAAAGKKMYGCALPPLDPDDTDSDSFVPVDMSNLTFAPSDVTPIALSAKDDVKGLGYSGLDPTLALPGSHINLFSNPVRTKKTSRGIRGHAFGVGALENDDEDIYAQDSLANYDMTMRDGEADEEKQDSNFGWTAPRSHGKQKVPVSYVGKLLEGFCLSSKPLKPKKKYPPPSLPPNFKPFHWSRRRKKEDAEGSRNQMTAVDRGLMLGETPIMNSVFDLVSAGDKSRIRDTQEAIAMTKSLTKSREGAQSSRPGNQIKEEIDNNVPTPENTRPRFLSKFTPAVSENSETKVTVGAGMDGHKPLFQGGMSLQPFRKDPDKQARYEQYLAAVKRGASDPYAEVSLYNRGTQTEWEKAKERDEFARSARLFRPMSAMMSSRFVEGAMLDDKAQEALKEDKEAASDEVKAAEMKMFGKLTREEHEWHPDKLLCRRFNVPNPYPGSDIVGLPFVKRDKYSVFNFLTVGDFRPNKPASIPDSGGHKETSRPTGNESFQDVDGGDNKASKKKKATLSSIFKVLDDPNFHKLPEEAKKDVLEQETVRPENQQGEDEETEEPDVDLFRAIFKNSDSEDSEEGDEKKMESEKSEDENSDRELQESMNEDAEHNERAEEGSVEANSNLSSGVIGKPMDFTETLKEDKKDNDERHGGSSAIGKSQLYMYNESEKTPDRSSTVRLAGAENPFSSVVRDPSIKSRRSQTRWGFGAGAKSVFSVLDEVNNDVNAAVTSGRNSEATQRKDDEGEYEDGDSYGPALPPSLGPVSATPTTSWTAGGGDLYKSAAVKEKRNEEEEVNKHRTHRHHSRDGISKHRKDKKKKSKHKKEKKRKKSKMSSSSSKSKRRNNNAAADSGSDANSESSNQDDSDEEELLDKWKQVSGSKSKSTKS